MLPLLVLVVCATSLAADMTLVRLPITDNTGPSCLDGSAPAMYVHTSAFSNKWVIELAGGGWCSNVTDQCYERAKTPLGSSVNYTGSASGNGFGTQMSEFPWTNPHMWLWNRAFLMYCDGGMWTSDSSVVGKGPDGSPLYFRGKRNLDALITLLNTSYGLDKATDVLYTGLSAGAIGVFASADRVRNVLLPHVKNFRAIPNSGFMINIPLYNTTTNMAMQEYMRNLVEIQNCTSGLNSACVAAKGADAYLCMFSEVATQYVTTPFFVQQSKYDFVFESIILFGLKPELLKDWQACIEKKSACSPAQLSILTNEWARPFQTRVLAAVGQSMAARGAWIENDFSHCYASGRTQWEDTYISGITVRDAWNSWFFNLTSSNVYISPFV